MTHTTIDDDFPATVDTTGTVEVGGSATGEVEYESDRDWFAVELEAGKTYQIDVATAISGGGSLSERTVPAKPCFEPSGVQLEDGVHARAVLGGQEEEAQHVVRIVEELAQTPRGGERRGGDVDTDEVEQLMVVEGGGSGALDAGDERYGGGRRGSGAGRIGRGGLGADGGGKGGIGRHDGSILGGVGRGPEALSPRRPATPSRPLRSTSRTGVVRRRRPPLGFRRDS